MAFPMHRVGLRLPAPMPACGGGLLLAPACGWAYPGAGLIPCAPPGQAAGPAGEEGTSLTPPGLPCGAGFSAECAVIGPLERCLSLCAADSRCDAV